MILCNVACAQLDDLTLSWSSSQLLCHSGNAYLN
jgi:hypothetical protein